ncbi:hypothetical protein ACOSP6_06505 [Tenacibaculum sp. MEBiC06402]|uniref:hypothetical protein n=1 Tax=unclassified Tenacibaculum TaxID=2635139 RepID=UPI003B9C7CBD
MSIKSLNVTVANNLNAIVKDGKNVNAVLTFYPDDALEASTPQIGGGQSYNLPKGLEFNTDNPKMRIHLHANRFGDMDVFKEIPVNAKELYINLQGTYNGEADIECNFS